MTTPDLAAITARAEAIPAEHRTWGHADEHGASPATTPAWCVNDLRDGEWVGDVAYIPQHAPDQEALAAHMAGMDPATTLALVARVTAAEADAARLRAEVEEAEANEGVAVAEAETAEAERDTYQQRLETATAPFSDAAALITEQVTGMHGLTRAAAHSVVSEVLRRLRAVLDSDGA